MTHRVTKTYGHQLGLSATFRQPKAKSHCRFIHGYALGFKFVFECDKLDENGWVKDFGSLKPLKQWLCDTFDHKTVLAEDDPHLDEISALTGIGCMDIIVVPKVGCESFARMAWEKALDLITADEFERGVRIIEVECREHAGNAASYMGS